MHQSLRILREPPSPGNPWDSDTFMTSHPGDYDHDGIQTQGQFWH